MGTKQEKMRSWGAKVAQGFAKWSQMIPKTMPKSIRNIVFFVLGQKCGFVYPSYTESLFLGVPGTKKIKKMRLKIGPVNRRSPVRRFLGFLGPQGGQGERKVTPKGAPRSPKGTPKWRQNWCWKRFGISGSPSDTQAHQNDIKIFQNDSKMTSKYWIPFTRYPPSLADSALKLQVNTSAVYFVMQCKFHTWACLFTIFSKALSQKVEAAFSSVLQAPSHKTGAKRCCARAAPLVFEIMQKTRVGGRRTACPYDNLYKSEKQRNKQKLISYGHLFGTKLQSRIKQNNNRCPEKWQHHTSKAVALSPTWMSVQWW